MKATFIHPCCFNNVPIPVPLHLIKGSEAARSHGEMTCLSVSLLAFMIFFKQFGHLFLGTFPIIYSY